MAQATVQLNIRIPADDYKKMESKAEAANAKVGLWARSVLVKAAN